MIVLYVVACYPLPGQIQSIHSLYFEQAPHHAQMYDATCSLSFVWFVIVSLALVSFSVTQL